MVPDDKNHHFCTYICRISRLLFSVGVPRGVPQPVHDLQRDCIQFHIHSVWLHTIMGYLSPKDGKACDFGLWRVWRSSFYRCSSTKVFQMHQHCFEVSKRPPDSYQWPPGEVPSHRRNGKAVLPFSTEHSWTQSSRNDALQNTQLLWRQCYN